MDVEWGRGKTRWEWRGAGFFYLHDSFPGTPAASDAIALQPLQGNLPSLL